MKIEYFPDTFLKTIKICKSTNPIVFLDSCFIIELKNVENGKIDSPYYSEYKKILELLRKKIMDNKLQCAFGEQDAEIGRVKSKLPNVDFLYSLSQGVKLKGPEEIEKMQTDKAFSNFINNDKEIIIEYNEGFRENTLVSRGYNLKFKWLDSPELIKIFRDEKTEIASVMNNLRESGNVKKRFLDQLACELTETTRIILRILQKKIDKQDLTQIEMKYWKEMYERIYGFKDNNSFLFKEDQTDEYKRYLDFLCSPYYFQIPFYDIEKNIYTYRLLDQKKYIPSDFIDERNAAAFLPYVDIFATDKAFHRCLTELHLDERYQTKVFSVSNLDEFFALLETI